jgi:hypothetical protein
MSDEITKQPEYTVASIGLLDLKNKQSIVDLLVDVQLGNVSCRRAATEIQKQIPKKQLTAEQRKRVRQLRTEGMSVKSLAIGFQIDPATVWRICKSNDNHQPEQA